MYLHCVVKIPSFPLISAEKISLINEEELIIQLFSGLFSRGTHLLMFLWAHEKDGR